MTHAKDICIASALAAAVTCLSWSASAQECYRHEECDGQELCIDTVCTPSDVPLPTCETAADCDDDGGVSEGGDDGTTSTDSDGATGAARTTDDGSTTWDCDEGYCKRQGVYCENPAGSCYAENQLLECGCATGEGAASSSDGSPEAYTDAELYAQCVENLVEMCGEEAPDLDDACTEAQLELCTPYYEKMVELATLCDDDVSGMEYAITAECCEGFADEDDAEWWGEYYDCMMALEAETCEDVEACDEAAEGAGGDDLEEASSADGDANDEATATDTADAGGCSAVPRAPSSGSLLATIF